MLLPEGLKKYQWILISGVVLLLGFSIWSLLKTQTPVTVPNNGQSGQINEPSTNTLQFAEIESLKEFVKNFAELYNTYRFEDFSNLTALGDYQSAAMQEVTLSRVADLEKNLKPGDAVYAKANPTSFSYQVLNGQDISAEINLKISEYANEFPESETQSLRDPVYSSLKREYEVKFNLKIQKFSQAWLVLSAEPENQ
jgi:hypothetical protein